MSRPQWKLVANPGDTSPLIHGGYFIYVDETGVYQPEAELVECPCDDIDLYSPKARWTVYRFILEPCTYSNGILSDNPFHPELPAWFATPEALHVERPQDTTYLSRVANTCGIPLGELIADFCSKDPIKLAAAYRAVGEYHGFDNLDQDPLELTRKEINKRYPDLP